ncbi:MAG: fibronectin type III domain-containing protein [Nitrospirae bacterium]|nr:fibronectin type III domain-containing protein [Nitrospirota bacterium]
MLSKCKKEVRDTQSPSVPSGIIGNALSPYEIKVLWSASTDDTAVVEYRVYQKQGLLESIKTTSASYKGLTPDSAYCINLTALDSTGNESGHSKEVCIKTPGLLIAKAKPVVKPKVEVPKVEAPKEKPPKVEVKRIPKPPEPPSGLKARPISSSQIDLTWSPSTAELGVSGYNIYREGTLHKSVTTASASYTGLKPQSTYCFTISVVDSAGNESGKTREVCATTLTVEDKGPPTPPTGLKAEPVGTTQINLTWNPSKDDREVTGYNVYSKGVLSKTEKATASQMAKLNPNTRYCYSVTAFDDAGNESSQSGEACAVTAMAPDIGIPSVPSGLSAIASAPTQVDLSWNASTDDVGVTGYNIYKDGAFLKSVTTTSTSYRDEDLGETSCYTVSSLDSAGNESGKSRQVCVMMKAVSARGTVWAGGMNDYGQIGDGTTTSKTTLVQVGGISTVMRITAGMEHTVVLKEDGTVWAWGRNLKGQLGDGTTVDRHTPVQVKGLSDVTAIAAGWYHTVALKKDGTVWVWGRNYYGQLGDGTSADRSTPVQVKGLTDVTAIAAGWYHTVAVKKDGSVWAWGWNFRGQLGDGTTDDSKVPIPVRDIKDVIALSAGQHHSVALKKDGTVWAWGWNDSGQIGNGTTIPDKYLATEVKGLTGIKAIVAGGSHTLALKKDGSIWAWGANEYGQLGDGTSVPKSIPTKIEAVPDVYYIAAGMNQTVALKSDGTLWAWGWGLKVGQRQEKFTPVRISGIVGITEISAGMYHIVALKGE